MNLEMMKRAKMYVDEMLMGINPVTKEVVENETINEEKVVVCLNYLSNLLTSDIKREVSRRGVAIPFKLNAEEIKKYNYEDGLSIKHIVEKINNLKSNLYMKDLKVTDVTKWLVINGFLEVRIVDGRKGKLPTEKGKKFGIYTESRIGMYHSYELVLYKIKIQRYILENLDSICRFSNFSNFEDVLI